MSPTPPSPGTGEPSVTDATCPHAQTTTILWLYGEADAGHAAHVADCSACTAVADQHLDVQLAVPIPPSEPADVRANAPSPAWTAAPRQTSGASGWRRSIYLVSGAIALIAAAALLVVAVRGPSADAPDRDTGQRAVAAPVDLPLASDEEFGGLHDDIDALEADIDALEADLAVL